MPRCLPYQYRPNQSFQSVQHEGPDRVATAVSDSSLVAREAMIESQLKPCGISSPRVATAFYGVARELFVTPDRRRLAYVDAPQPLTRARELMAPLSLAYLLQAADIAEHEHVLVVGAATGYATAVIACLAARVTALESDSTLAASARTNLQNLANVAVVEGPLDGGWAEAAPYDAIVMNGAIETLPDAFDAQLRPGGRLLAVWVGDDGIGRPARGIKHGGLLTLEPFAESPARVLPGFAKPRGFQF